ncbi:nuclear transport factor 2 family protein [Paraburkholderia bengalensis]|uniref:Nuclear transport factor 2 family protein n=1 Tax=Paraburkholderia bengalensis TaxID=2747562 RepID=A0ABU8IL66_9BURK
MSDQLTQHQTDIEPITWEAAETALRLSEERFQAGDIEGLISKYDEDIVIRFASLPDMHGRETAKRWLEKRLKRQLNYTLKKVLLAIDGQKVIRSWTGHWIDSETGKKMEGRGIEYLEYRHGKVVMWDACFHVWEDGKRLEHEYFELP